MFESVAEVSDLEKARAALRSAERRVGVRHREERVTLAPAVPLPLTGLLPGGELPRGAAVTVAGSASLLCWLLGATQAGRWAVVVGWPQLGGIALAEAGVDLERVALVPDVRGEGATVLAALVDGAETVVAGPDVRLTPGERRRLLARAREREATLVCPTDWEGAALGLRVERAEWGGASRGDFWLREARLAVVRRSRMDGAGQRFMVVRDRAGAITVQAAVAAKRVREAVG
ncbi:hypothetical protein [Antribacter gilvus]|uniref:hypothetical protein n=1 Tax=Antribacter gilvus TaxID=2304675 RepID=UPI000F7B1B11|nr:hypothetical protein [Antribacter gilvus]